MAGQTCSLSITGKIFDESQVEVVAATILLDDDENVGTVSDLHGNFQLTNLCAGAYKLVISSIGMKPIQQTIQLQRDTNLVFYLEAAIEMIEEVTVFGERPSESAQQTYFINQSTIDESLNANLSDLTNDIVGVNTLKNGASIGKPIVHGLYGNRLAILNNGIAQSGQQWGSDHAPEIDPFSSNRIYVLKGASALEHQGSVLGNVIVTESYISPYSKNTVNSFFESNGRGLGVNAQIQQWTDGFAWKINGTLKKSGDKHTPDYYLNNTGYEEADFSFQVQKSWSSKLKSEVYLSTFNTNLGVLRGSHIGNLSDLETALSREVPFFTEPDFSYQIDAPMQQVNHHLLKLNTDYELGGNRLLNFLYAVQLNNRKEFDVRRSGRSEFPALSLTQWTHFAAATYKQYFTNGLELKTGIQLNIVDNVNNPETGILPLIPDYLNTESGTFFILRNDYSAAIDGVWEVGVRYDNAFQSVATFSQTIPIEVIVHSNFFHNVSANAGYVTRQKWGKLAVNTGFGSRNPAINELYSFGLHQGVSGIEEGNADLGIERNIKSTLSYDYENFKKLDVSILVYHQFFKNYIFLNPQDEFRLTIRGAFPVFRYEQTDAHIYGFDLLATYYFNKKIKGTVAYSFIKGQDLLHNIPLIYMPSNNILAAVRYKLPDAKTFKDNVLQVQNRYVFEQKNLLPTQDFVLPPTAYNLVGVKFSTKVAIKKSQLKIYVKVNNLLNTTYRDYLNRQRYFADDLGRNVIIGTNLNF